MQLTYAIKYVADMDKAVAFHRDVLGLPLKFQSPEWSEFATGDTTLALRSATADKQAGSGRAWLRKRRPRMHGGMHIAQVRHSEGAGTSISGPA